MLGTVEGSNRLGEFVGSGVGAGVGETEGAVDTGSPDTKDVVDALG